MDVGADIGMSMPMSIGIDIDTGAAAAAGHSSSRKGVPAAGMKPTGT